LDPYRFPSNTPPKDENELTSWLIEGLRSTNYFIEVKQANLSSAGLDEFCKKYYANLGVMGQQIDVVLTTKDKLMAIEVKYFKPEDKGWKKLYEGIGQVALYLMLGFDKVALLHFFHPDIHEEEALNCAELTRELFEKDLVDGTLHVTNYICAKFEKYEPLTGSMNYLLLRKINDWPPSLYDLDPYSLATWLVKIALHNTRLHPFYKELKRRRECLKVALKAPIP